MIGAAAAEKKLYNAASNGDVTAFQEVVREDAYVLEEATFACSRNLLHIATMRGQAGIVEEVLKMNPRLARSLDSEKASPLHIAAAEGNVEIAQKLLTAVPEMRWSLDFQNMNPIHIAAMKGNVEVLKELLQSDYLPAMERVHRGQTVLHLCVKHRQLEALEVLVEKLGELVNAKDEDGETILHWAVRNKEVEMIRYLVEGKKIKKDTKNSMGETALKIWNESPPDTTNNHSEIRISLLRLADETFLERAKITNMTMVVMVLIATMAYQAAISPPGGVWQDGSSKHKAGEAVMAFTNLRIYRIFVYFNTTAFASSILTISLLTTTLPSNSILYFRISIFGMLLSLSCIGISYTVAMLLITPDSKSKSYTSYAGTLVVLSVTSFGGSIGWACIYTRYLLWKAKREQSLSRGIF